MLCEEYFSLRLLEAGAKVCISDINQEVGDSALEELKERFDPTKVCFVACDVCQEEQFSALFDQAEQFFKVSCVDILANNAGVNTNFGWRKCMEVNIISVMLGTELAMQRMRKAGKAGQIINTASMAGLAPGLNEEMTPYTVSKHGVVALTRTLAKVSSGISHKCLCPAWTDTNMVSSAVKEDVRQCWPPRCRGLFRGVASNLMPISIWHTMAYNNRTFPFRPLKPTILMP